MDFDNNRKALIIMPIFIVIVSLVGNAYLAIDSFTSLKELDRDIMMAISALFCALSLVPALWYLFTGFQKKSSKYLKLYLSSFIITELLTVIGIVTMFLKFRQLGLKTPLTMVTDFIIDFVILVLLLILLFKKDLGQKLSKTLANIILIGSSISLILALLIQNISFITNALIFRWIGNISLALVLVIMQQLKYYDKAQRNTK